MCHLGGYAMGTTNQDGHLVPDYSYQVPQGWGRSCCEWRRKAVNELRTERDGLFCLRSMKWSWKSFWLWNRMFWVLSWSIKRNQWLDVCLDSICEPTHTLMIPYLSQCHNFNTFPSQSMCYFIRNTNFLIMLI